MYKAFQQKANYKDVQEGFANLKNHYNSVLQERRFDFVSREEIGNLINEKLLLNNGDNFEVEGFIQKRNKLSFESTLSQRLQNYPTKQEIQDYLSQLELKLVKREEIYMFQEEIQHLSKALSNLEIETKLKDEDLE